MEKNKSTVLRLAGLVAFGLFAAASSVAPPSHAQAVSSGCPAGGFDLCFPNLDSGAPSAACSNSAPDAGDITACLGRVCGGAATEPEPGFFSYCCAAGGSVRYDDFCVFEVQKACGAVAERCVDRCPPLELLMGTVAIAPPLEACVIGYPAFIASVCEADPFCCTTSWDGICASEALAASGAP